MAMVERRRRLLVLAALYLLLDFSNPFMPGAFEFGLSDSVVGLGQERARASAPLGPEPAPVPRPAAQVEPVSLRRAAPAPTPRGRAEHWLPVAAARSRPSEPGPASGPDDH